MINSAILVNVIRGETVESIHRGHLIVVDGEGSVIVALGDPDTATFFRSAAKPFQAIPFITSGAVERFGFSNEEIALACASHSGEEMHTRLAAEMLKKIGLAETDLRCGAHLPFHEPTAREMILKGIRPTQLHNNCSGKHSAMLASAIHTGADNVSYENLENPVQQQIVKCVAQFTQIPEERIAIGIDGCAAPNFALPVSAMALSFARLVNPPEFIDDASRAACGKIVSIMSEYPEVIGGTGRLDTLMMQAARGRLISKVGAEGLYLAAVLPCDKWKTGLGIAIKIEDGEDNRARPVAAVELLRRLGIFEKTDLLEFSPLATKNRRGDVVGRVVPAF